MKRRVSSIGLILAMVLVLLSCEDVFTTSLLEWGQRDPSNLSRDQKISYAQDALASGDKKAMKEAYDALKDTTDPALQPFVAELAVGAAGIKDALLTVLGDVAAGSSEETIKTELQAAYNSFDAEDLALMESAAQLLTAAESGGGSISADQYFITGIGLLVVALDEAGGDVENIDTTAGAGQTAISFLTKAKDTFSPDSEAASLLADFISYF
ncbi:MAG: hypothetical protein KA771_04075 [Spirochaetales bacterium]|nr:hypothetical protein [Spirochaetales bacterium]